MLLLTESTLFFLNQTSSYNATSRKKFAKHSLVDSWNQNMSSKSKPPALPINLTQVPPSPVLSQAPTRSSTATSAGILGVPDDEALVGNFGDEVDDSLERQAAHEAKTRSMAKSTVIHG
jgi:hypothetical protein